METVVVRPRFIWGQGETNLLQVLVTAVQSGRFLWIDRGRYQISTCHVDNVCEGLWLAYERGRAGEVYFVTDGEPVEWRAFITALLQTQSITPGKASLPRWLAWALAYVAEGAWRLLRLKGSPPITRVVLRLSGDGVTVVDAKARRELGYVGRVSRAEGLAELATAALR